MLLDFLNRWGKTVLLNVFTQKVQDFTLPLCQPQPHRPFMLSNVVSAMSAALLTADDR